MAIAREPLINQQRPARFSGPENSSPSKVIMTGSAANYLINLTRLARGNRVLQPLIATYYVTTQCNFNCTYCEYFGARRNPQAEEQLDLERAMHVLKIMRTGVDSLLLTGGEPLLHPDIDQLIDRARHTLKFRHLTLLTNGSLLPDHEAILAALDRLVISLDSTDSQVWSNIIGTTPGVAQHVLDNIRTYAARQPEFGYHLIVNCVITPQTLSHVRTVLDFCEEHRILISFSPQSVNNWPHYDLLTTQTYRDFIQHLIDRKRAGAPILGSLDYFKMLHDFTPYICYPLLVPRVMPNGDLVYPCRPIELGGTTHGGRPCNLLEVGSWDEAIRLALQEYDEPPQTCTSCFQQCFAEPSLLQAHPLSLLRELRYAPSRQGAVWKHAPG
jgi:MoaA/NifB/PqqE/SkfB family radical SAM enzyme